MLSTHLISLTVGTNTKEQWLQVIDLCNAMASSLNDFSYVNVSSVLNDDAEESIQDGLRFDDNTMFKVYDVIKAALPMNHVVAGEDSTLARDIIDAIQNAGIVFRERM